MCRGGTLLVWGQNLTSYVKHLIADYVISCRGCRYAPLLCPSRTLSGINNAQLKNSGTVIILVLLLVSGYYVGVSRVAQTLNLTLP